LFIGRTFFTPLRASQVQISNEAMTGAPVALATEAASVA
jgi:hypothetical protein